MKNIPINSDILMRLYYDMVRIRLVEQAIAKLYPEQQMRCPVHLSVGQEAVAVGVCAHLSAQDYVLSGHRSHSHYLAKGGNLKAMLAELYGKQTGCAGGKGGSMHLIDLAAGFLGAVPIVGSTIPITVGVAMGLVMRSEPGLAVAFFGEGATEEGVFHEAVNFARLKQLPVLFVCENNLYSVYSPLHVRQPAERSLARLAEGYGVTCYQGDGNDAVEIYRLTQQAITHIREQRGPVLMEFMTYRWLEHCGPYFDNHLGYRTEAEFQDWRQRDPIARLERVLQEQGRLEENQMQAMTNRINAEIDEAVRFARSSPDPAPQSLFEYIFANQDFN